MKYVVSADNKFNAAWLAYLLGEPRPDDELAADGFDMADDTPSVRTVASVVGLMRKRGQIVVETIPS